MKITVSYTYSIYSPCGDLSCCSDSYRTIDFESEDGKRWEDENAPYIENEQELLDHAKELYPEHEIAVDAANCQFY